MNNNIHMIGILQDGFIISHANDNEMFYKSCLVIKRDSGTKDIINLIVSEYTIYSEEYNVGDRVELSGEVRTRNYEGKVYVYVFVNDIKHTEKPDINNVELWGYICQTPKYRTTPAGREITDVILKVERHYNRLDFIPCIIWGRDGRKILSCTINSTDNELIYINGRLQSREYNKHNEVKVAYEVSVNGVVIYDRNNKNRDSGFIKNMSG